MSTQTMGSQSGGGQQPQFLTPPRQGSLYNLTLNEVQNHLGEPLLSMNLDELIRNVLPPEGEQPFDLDLETPQIASVSGIQRQGSLTLSRALSKKTVDEVWKDILQGQNKSREEPAHERQPTFGEMTLEDFLVKAGVVAEGSGKDQADMIVGSSGSADPMLGARQGYPQGIHWLQQYHQMPSLQQQQIQQSMVGAYAPSSPLPQSTGVGAGNILDAGYPDSRLSISSDSQTPGRKRVAHCDIVEKTVERRQKRMIKNRESAARSRARKQAYTNELENKVSRLEEENERLRKQQELNKILCAAPPPEPKFQLRRTSSAPP